VVVRGGRMPKFIGYKDALEETEGKKRNLLLGNGFSIACDPRFEYESLFKKANFKEHSSLQNVFENLKTCNFEEVIRELHKTSTHLRVMSAYRNSEKLKKSAEEISSDIRNAKLILLNVIKDTHPDKQTALTEDQYKSSRRFLKNFIGHSLVSHTSNVDINKEILITDTSVLINFLNIKRLDLLIKYPGKFLITEHVIEEITIDFPGQQALLNSAISDGLLLADPIQIRVEIQLFF